METSVVVLFFFNLENDLISTDELSGFRSGEARKISMFSFLCVTAVILF